MIFLLVGACFFLNSMAGCAGGSPPDDGDIEEVAEDGIPFFERGGAVTEELPIEWLPVSDYVIEQIRGRHEAQGLVLESLERSSSGSRSAVRCRLAPRTGSSQKKTLLDGLYLLYLNFPGQSLYEVEVEGRGGGSMEAVWNDLVALNDEGYSFDTPSEQAAEIWRHLFGSETGETETDNRDPGDSTVGVQSKGKDTDR